MSGRHRKPTASAKKVAKIAFTAAGSQRADHAGSGGRSAGARADCPLSAMPVKAQYIIRAGVLAFALGVGAAVANTPAVAFAEPTDTSSLVSGSSSSTSSSSSESAASTSSTDPTSSTDSSASAAASSSGSTSGVVQRSVDAQASSTSSPTDAPTADPRSGIKKRSGDAQASSTSSPTDASTADPRSGIKKSSGGAHTSSTPSSSDTTTSAGATPTQTGVPAAVATAAPAEPPAAALPTEQPTAASPTEQPAAPAPSAEPVPSPGAREAATPETPVATAAAPTPDAPHHESHTAPNFAGSDPTNRSGSATSTSANRQSTVVVQAAATPASTAQPRTATQAAVESVASTFSAVEGALETAVEGALETRAVPLETRAVPKAFSAPVAPPDVVSGVVSNALASVGLSPVVSNNPLAPVDSPAELAVLAWARRQNQQTQSSFGRLFAVGVSSEEPALAPLNPQALSQDPNAGFYQGISMAYRPIDGTNVDVRHPSENAAGTGEAQTVIADEVGRAETNNVVVGQGGPITITTGGTYTGSYQSNNRCRASRDYFDHAAGNSVPSAHHRKRHWGVGV